MGNIRKIKDRIRAPIYVLAVGLLLTVGLSAHIFVEEQDAQAMRFHLAAEAALDSVNHTMRDADRVAGLLNQIVATFDTISATQFAPYSRLLQTHWPYAKGFSHADTMHSDSPPALHRAALSGKTIASDFFALPDNGDKTLGFRLMSACSTPAPAPVPATVAPSAVRCVTSVLISAPALFRDSVSGLVAGPTGRRHFSVFSGKQENPAHLIYHWPAQSAAGEALPRCRFVCEVNTLARTYYWAGKFWHVVVRDQAAFSELHAGALSVLLTGLLTSMGAAFVGYTQRAQTGRFINLADQRATELRTLSTIFTADIVARKALAEQLEKSHKDLRDFAEHNAKIKEDERKRIAREIHDDLGQTMLALRIDLSMMTSGDPQQMTPERINARYARLITPCVPCG